MKKLNQSGKATLVMVSLMAFLSIGVLFTWGQTGPSDPRLTGGTAIGNIRVCPSKTCTIQPVFFEPGVYFNKLLREQVYGTYTPTPLFTPAGASPTFTPTPTATVAYRPYLEFSGSPYVSFACVTITDSTPVTVGPLYMPGDLPITDILTNMGSLEPGVPQPNGVTIVANYFSGVVPAWGNLGLAFGAISRNPTQVATPYPASGPSPSNARGPFYAVYSIGIGPTATITPWIACPSFKYDMN